MTSPLEATWSHCLVGNQISYDTASVNAPTLVESCLLTYDASSNAELLRIVQQVPEEFWAGRLCLPLLVERLMGDQSHFWPYLQTLPNGVPGLPLFYSETALQALQYPPLIEQVAQMRETVL